LDHVQSIAREARGEASRTITGTVTEADGSPATDVRVHVTGADGAHLTRARVDESGAFTVSVPDADAQVWAYRRGAPIAGPAAAPRDGGEITLEMAPMGTIEVRARDASSGSAVPARVQLFPVGRAITRPDGSWGERSLPSERADVRFAGASGE